MISSKEIKLRKELIMVEVELDKIRLFVPSTLTKDLDTKRMNLHEKIIELNGLIKIEQKIREGWQDEERIYTNIERVYATRIDCSIQRLAAA